MTIAANRTRNEEALLAGAGDMSEHDCRCDLRLNRLDDAHWQILTISPRADAWIREELCYPLRQGLSDAIVVDVLSADRLLKKAQADGLRTEFVGRSGMDIF